MLIVVGGHTRNIGKTSVIAGLIRTLPALNWTAVKITQYGHGVCSAADEPCDCAGTDYLHPYAITEEHDAQSGTDSARYLAAGARRSFWVRTPVGQLGAAVPAIRKVCDSGANTIVESNSILQFLKPDLYLVVVDFAIEDFKQSTLAYLDRADALVTSNADLSAPAWKGISGRLWNSKPQFPAEPPEYVGPALKRFVVDHLNVTLS